jgi:hypothetical protein
MPLEDRSLTPGTVLVARSKGRPRTCEVVQSPDGLRYRLDDGTEHKSPSGAAKAAMGGVSCNGWRYWSLAERARPAPRPRARNHAEKKVKKLSKTATKATRRKRSPTAMRTRSRLQPPDSGLRLETPLTIAASPEHAPSPATS